MFVARHAKLPPGFRFHLSVNVQIFLCNALYRVFAVIQSFFPRVRTPCGHGAQVIVEGRKEQSDGGEKNKDNQNNPKQDKAQPTGRVSTIL